jgi:hypothetical protein
MEARVIAHRRVLGRFLLMRAIVRLRPETCRVPGRCSREWGRDRPAGEISRARDRFDLAIRMVEGHRVELVLRRSLEGRHGPLPSQQRSPELRLGQRTEALGVTRNADQAATIAVPAGDPGQLMAASTLAFLVGGFLILAGGWLAITSTCSSQALPSPSLIRAEAELWENQKSYSRSQRTNRDAY